MFLYLINATICTSFVARNFFSALLTALSHSNILTSKYSRQFVGALSKVYQKGGIMFFREDLSVFEILLVVLGIVFLILVSGKGLLRLLSKMSPKNQTRLIIGALIFGNIIFGGIAIWSVYQNHIFDQKEVEETRERSTKLQEEAAQLQARAARLRKEAEKPSVRESTEATPE